MLIKFFVSFCLLILLSSCSSSLTQPIRSFQIQSPRPFGYVIGDEIPLRLQIDVRKGLELQYSSIPAKGEINRWLNLNKVKVHKFKQDNNTVRYQIDLTYQLFYAPLEVKMLEIPGFSLEFRQFGKPIKQNVPNWHFTAAPLRELAIRKQDGKEYMRSDQPAPLLDTTSVNFRLLLILTLALLSGGFLAWLYGLLNFVPKQLIFAKPNRQLARLPDDEIEKMLVIMHQALNQLNGKPLFKHQCSDFYHQFPRFNKLKKELDWFFDFSNAYFFGPGKKANNSAQKIRQLALHCLQIERGQ